MVDTIIEIIDIPEGAAGIYADPGIIEDLFTPAPEWHRILFKTIQHHYPDAIEHAEDMITVGSLYIGYRVNQDEYKIIVAKKSGEEVTPDEQNIANDLKEIIETFLELPPEQEELDAALQEINEEEEGANMGEEQGEWPAIGGRKKNRKSRKNRKNRKSKKNKKSKTCKQKKSRKNRK